MKLKLLLAVLNALVLLVSSQPLTVKQSSSARVDQEKQVSKQCDGSELGELTRADEAEFIKSMLNEALTKREIPSYSRLVVGKEAILSTKNIESHRVSNPQDFQLLLMSPAEIQRRADQKGDLMFLQFKKLRVEGSCAAVELCNLWADGTSTIETGPKTFLGEGCIYYVFYKESGSWVAKYITGWIS